MDQKIMSAKNRIKALAVLQKKGKRARKTTLPVEEFNALKKELTGRGPDEDWAPWRRQVAVEERRAEITALLNYYHELRGRTEKCHHNPPKGGYDWGYSQFWKELHEEAEAA